MKTKLLILVLISAAFAGSVSAQMASAKQQQIANEVVPAMVQAGVLRVDAATGRAWISPLLWAQFDAKAKADCSAAIAVYISPDNPVVEIYDAQSARKLARFGSALGFTVY